MTEINFCSIPYLSTDYSNVIDFENRIERDKFFDENTLYRLDLNMKYDGARTYINANLNLEFTRNFDYIWYYDSHNDKRYFYFITDVEMVTTRNCNIYLKLDVWTTYMFNYNILPSFVDRCHVPRWNGDIPTQNNEDEGLEKGEIIQIEEPTEIATMNKNVVICTSVPIGYVSKPFGNGGTGGSGNWWEEGKLSPQGFRFIKGMEGFAPQPYQDSGGYWTICYGVTKHGEPTIYNNLVEKVPVSEEEGAKISYELKNTNYGSKILSAVKGFGCTEQHQFDALLSLAYNSGVGSVTGDNSLTRALSQGITDEARIRPIWEKFKITSNGIELNGLKALRKEQCNMFFGKEFEIRPISLINSSGNISGIMTENNGDGWLPTGYGEHEEGDLNGYKSFNNDFGNDWLCPVKGGTVTSKYGWRTHPITGVRTFHHGTDIGLATGSPTVATKSGTITDLGYSDSMGYYIYLDSGDYRTKYMHLSKIDVNKGKTVKRGDKIGEIGSTGNSTGPHCHWEIRRLSDNESCDPAPNLKKGDKV